MTKQTTQQNCGSLNSVKPEPVGSSSKDMLQRDVSRLEDVVEKCEAGFNTLLSIGPEAEEGETGNIPCPPSSDGSMVRYLQDLSQRINRVSARIESMNNRNQF